MDHLTPIKSNLITLLATLSRKFHIFLFIYFIYLFFGGGGHFSQQKKHKVILPQ